MTFKWFTRQYFRIKNYAVYFYNANKKYNLRGKFWEKLKESSNDICIYGLGGRKQTNC